MEHTCIPSHSRGQVLALHTPSTLLSSPHVISFSPPIPTVTSIHSFPHLAHVNLDLRHARPTFPDSAGAEIHTAAACAEKTEEQRAHIAGPAEPEEGGGGLLFAAAAGAVVRAVC
jgi:hypothetical protein